MKITQISWTRDAILQFVFFFRANHTSMYTNTFSNDTCIHNRYRKSMIYLYTHLAILQKFPQQRVNNKDQFNFSLAVGMEKHSFCYCPHHSPHNKLCGPSFILSIYHYTHTLLYSWLPLTILSFYDSLFFLLYFLFNDRVIFWIFQSLDRAFQAKTTGDNKTAHAKKM